MLEAEKHARESAPQISVARPRSASWRWLLSPLVACALLAGGFVAGQRLHPPAAVTADDSTKREILALHQQMRHQQEQLAQQNGQLEKMTTLVGYSILQQQQNPANERLRDVLLAARSEKPSDKTLDDLISALTLDPNANIRLRAIEALYPHAEREVVRAGVLAALPREQNALVQLELIDFVATAQDQNAAPVLEKICADETSDRAVRAAAQLALARF